MITGSGSDAASYHKTFRAVKGRSAPYTLVTGGGGLPGGTEIITGEGCHSVPNLEPGVEAVARPIAAAPPEAPTS